MKTLLNWSEISRAFTGQRNRVLKDKIISLDTAKPYVTRIKAKESEIKDIIKEYQMLKNVNKC